MPCPGYGSGSESKSRSMNDCFVDNEYLSNHAGRAHVMLLAEANAVSDHRRASSQTVHETQRLARRWPTDHALRSVGEDASDECTPMSPQHCWSGEQLNAHYA